MNHELYLSNVLEKLGVAIEDLEQKMEFRRSEISRMQEYFWESYTEYDEFGYEKMDNDRLLREEASAHSELVRKYAIYQKMLDSPYFAAVTFRYDGEDEAETYYIGIGDFSPSKADTPLVCDWRAPISSLFYDHEPGRASFKAPLGEIFGDLTRKFQYKIKGGKLLYVIDSDIVINDDILKKELSMNANARLRSIVSTIQKEQNAIIRNEKDKILVIEGCAGSGKTSVALHRIAYLLYHQRNKLTANQVLILSPNPVFSEYISHILPELGEENIMEMTLDLYAYRRLKKYKEAEDRYMYLEKLLTLPENEALYYQKQVAEKQSKEYVKALDEFVLSLEDSLMSFADFKYKKLEKSAEEIEAMFYSYRHVPVLERMKAVAECIIDAEETLTGKDFDILEREIIIEKLERMYENRNLLRLYNRFLEANSKEIISEETAFIPYEDVYPILYLEQQLYGVDKDIRIKHLIVDEMQDYSYIQFLLLSRMFDCSMTILGDSMQQAAPGRVDAQSICSEVFGEKAKLLKLNKSYRSTYEITQFADKIAGVVKDEEAFARHGKEPVWTECTDEETMYGELTEELDKEVAYDFDTIAVLTTTATQAERVYMALKDKFDVKLITADSNRMEKEIVITTYYLAKGLEFDSVHVAYAPKKEEITDYQRQILYIESTRALHKLSVYSV